MKKIIALSVAILLAGCSTTAPPLQEKMLTLAPTPNISDDLPLSSLADALDKQRSILANSSSTIMRFGPISITRGDYLKALERLREVIRSATTADEVYRFVESHFDFMEVQGATQSGNVLLTSYFEPLIDGSTVRTARLSQPLYRAPPDMVTVALPLFSERFKEEQTLRARIDGKKIVPYYSRSDIDGENRLSGRGLEICWVDPIDAFFLHIQGSGTVRLQNGEDLSLVYAEKNGRKYEAIGKFLKSFLPAGRITMHSIERYLRAQPFDEQQRYMFMNPSYVFFSPSTQRAITSLGAPATPGRTIAADPKVFPKGALAFLSFPKPTFRAIEDTEPQAMAEVSRFVVDQDSGGAITGPGRVDLFWGRGAEAKQAAGVIQEQARLMYLVPKR